MNDKKHLGTLHFLLVLTFIWSGLSLFSYAITALTLPSLQQSAESMAGLFPDEMKTMVDMFLALPRGFFAVGALLYGLELVGGVFMWRLHRAGFHCYTIARLLLLLVPLLFIGRDYFPIGDAMFAALYIVTYWLLLKSLGVFENKSNPADLQ